MYSKKKSSRPKKSKKSSKSSKGTKSTKRKGMDLPSSNFMGDLGQKSSKYAVSYKHMVSLPKKELKHQNPNKILQQMPLSDKYKQVMGPDQKSLTKYQDKKRKSSKSMRSYLKQRMTEREEALVRLKEQEEKERKSLPTTIFQDQDGQIRDKDGKIINLNVSFVDFFGKVFTSILQFVGHYVLKYVAGWL